MRPRRLSGPRFWIALVLVLLAALLVFLRFIHQPRTVRPVGAGFADPVELLADDARLRALAFPSPTLHDMDGDGLRDLVIGDRDGRVHLSPRAGESGQPTAQVRLAGGRNPLRVDNWCCIGTSLQLVDFDRDGFDDILTTTFEGAVFLVRGGARGFSRPERLLDSRDRPIVLSVHYDRESRRFANADRSPEGVTNARDHAVSATALDWDEDGDLDLLLGAREGRLYLQRNEGVSAAPAFTGVNELLTDGQRPILVPGGLSAARPADWDGDGLVDLVCGSFAGAAYLLRNVGAPGAPVFASPALLLAPDPSETDVAAGPDSDWYVDPVDVDGDGRLDLVVGGHRWDPPPERAPDDVAAARLSEILPEIRTLGAELNARVVGARRGSGGTPRELVRAYRRLDRDREVRQLRARLGALREEQRALRGLPSRYAGIWLYRQVSDRP